MRIAIIGGGVTGISAALHAEEAAHARGIEANIVLYEASDRLGGVIRSDLRDGFLIEGGPDTFVSEKPAPIHMAQHLGIDDTLLNSNEEMRKTFIYSRGRLHPLPEGVMMMVPTSFVPFVTSRLFSWAGKLRMGMDLFLPRGPVDEDETLGSFVRRRLGKEALDKLAEPLIAGIHASEPETMSLRSTFPRFQEMERAHRSLILGMAASRRKTQEFAKQRQGPKRTFFMSFREGMQQLTDAMAATLSITEIRFGTSVVGLSSRGGSWRVETAETSEDYDAVIVTVPAYAAAELVEGISSSVRDVLREIPYSSSVTVSLAFEKAGLGHDLKGFGFVIPTIERRRILAGTWCSSKFSFRAPDGKALIRAFIGGRHNEHLLDRPDDELASIALEELYDIMGIRSDPLFWRAYRWPSGMPQYVVGHRHRIETIEKETRRAPGLAIVGSAYEGVGVGDCILQGAKGVAKVFADFASS